MVGLPGRPRLCEATGDTTYREPSSRPPPRSSTRFDPDVGAMRSWDFGGWSYPVIIDNMMNLELLRASGRCPHADTCRCDDVGGTGGKPRVSHGRRACPTDGPPTTSSTSTPPTVRSCQGDLPGIRGRDDVGQGSGMGSVRVHDDVPRDRYRQLPRHRDATLRTVSSTTFPPDHDSLLGLRCARRFRQNPGTRPLRRLLRRPFSNCPRTPPALTPNATSMQRRAILTSLMSSTYLSDGTVSAGLLLHGTGISPSAVRGRRVPHLRRLLLRRSPAAISCDRWRLDRRSTRE